MMGRLAEMTNRQEFADLMEGAVYNGRDIVDSIEVFLQFSFSPVTFQKVKEYRFVGEYSTKVHPVVDSPLSCERHQLWVCVKSELDICVFLNLKGRLIFA